MDLNSTEDIINSFSDTVYRLAFARTGNKSDADEVYQETFLRLIKSKPKFTDEEHCKAWLIRVTVNCAKKLTGSAWRRKTVEMTEREEAVEFETAADISLFEEIQKLPPKYREVIHLCYFEDMTAEQIAKVLKRNPSTVRSQLKRAREQLKAIIEEENSYV
jgi:RNA polymerase sigma-70 factor (ECF subfamily)